MIDWLDSVLRRMGNISATQRRWQLVKSDQFGNFKVSLEALTNQLLYEIQWNGPLRAKGVVILHTGHHLTFYPTDINIFNKCYKFKSVKIFKFCCKNYTPAKTATITDINLQGRFVIKKMQVPRRLGVGTLQK